MAVRSKRSGVAAEIVFGIVAQLFIVLLFGVLATCAISENNIFGFNVLAVILGVGLSIGLWKHVEDVVRVSKKDKSY